jgi:GT2 family glycosyltransferase
MRVPIPVTTVIATRNRCQELRSSLPRHRGPVILVDNGSTDGTRDMVAREHPEVTLIPLSRNAGAVARNIGVQEAVTPLVAFADDDSWWAPGALERASAVFATSPRLAVVNGRILVGEDEVLDPTCDVMARSPLGTSDGLPGPSILGFVACGAVVRRSAFLLAHGFDDVIFFMGEEERLALDLMQLRWHLCYVDSVVAHHHPSADRDAASRERRAALVARNQVLTAVLRRPWSEVGRRGLAAARRGPAGRRGLGQAVARLPRAVRSRRPVGPHVEMAAKVVERASDLH